MLKIFFSKSQLHICKIVECVTLCLTVVIVFICMFFYFVLFFYILIVHIVVLSVI